MAEIPLVKVVNELGTVTEARADYPGLTDGHARLATVDEIARDAAAKADRADYESNPEAYTAAKVEGYAKAAEAKYQENEARANAALDGLGGPIQKALLGAGSAALLGPVGLTHNALGLAGSAIKGHTPGPGQIQDTLIRSQLGAMGGFPGAEAAMGGMFGTDFVNAIQKGSGYQEGQLGTRLGMAFGGPAALLGRGAGIARVAALEAAENAALGANDSLTDDYLAGNPLNASKALASAGISGFIGAAIPVGIMGTGKVIGAHLRRTGVMSEKALGLTDDFAKMRRNYIENGVDFDAMHKAAGSPDLGTVAGAEQMSKYLGDDISRLGREAAELRAKIPADVPVTPVRSTDIFDTISSAMDSVSPTWSSFVRKGDSYVDAARKAGRIEIARAQAIANPVTATPLRGQAARSSTSPKGGQWAPPFGTKQAVLETQKAVEASIGGAKILQKADELGGVTTKNLGDLKRFAESMGPKQRSGAKQMIAQFETNLTKNVVEVDPKIGARLKEIDAQKRMSELSMMDISEAVSKKVGGSSGASPFNWAMAAVGLAMGWHAPVGYLLGKVGIAGMKNIASRLAPTVAAANRVSAMVDSSASRISQAAKLAARAAAANREPSKPKPIKADPLSLAKTIRDVQPLVNGAIQQTPIGVASPKLDRAMAAKATQVGNNINAKIMELAPVAYANAMADSPNLDQFTGAFGPLGALVGGSGKSKKPKAKSNMGIGELTALMYAQAAMNPMETIESIQDMNFNNIQIEAMRDNWPELMDELANEMVVTIMDEGLSGDVSLENRARIAKIVGMPIDLSTSPDFFQQIQSVFVQPEDQQAPSPGPGNQRIPTNFATETEKLEEQ